MLNKNFEFRLFTFVYAYFLVIIFNGYMIKERLVFYFKISLIAIIFLICSIKVCMAQTFDNSFGRDLIYDDKNYISTIKTVLFYKKGFELNPPIFSINTDESLILEFDDLDNTTKEYYFTIIHCNSDWKPSQLDQSAYIDGFNQDVITKSDFSFNTLVSYIHYQLEFPNEQMKPTHSGNFILKIFDNQNPEQPVITRRFLVVEPKLNILATVKPSSNVEDRESKQEIDFTIEHPNFEIFNPFGDLKVVIMQNNRWDNAITELKPLFVKDHVLVYDYAEEATFDGNNEYRYFDAKSLRYRTEQIKSIEFDSSCYQFYLQNELMKTYKMYSILNDINGKFLVKNDEASDKNTESDYINVHFSLVSPSPVIGGNFYVFGDLSYNQCAEDFKLVYNKKTSLYERNILLKQGYYNYVYAFLDDKNRIPDLTLSEGNHFETGNNYSILVYYKSISDYGDRLIGYKSFNSNNR